MPLKYQLPDEFEAGKSLSAEALNKLIRALPANLNGPNIQRIGDSILFEAPETLGNANEETKTFVVISEFEDVLKCVSFDIADTILNYDYALGDSLLLNDNVVYVAKPEWLQKSYYENQSFTVDGCPTQYKFFENNRRVALTDFVGMDIAVPNRKPDRFETIKPDYYPGAIIKANLGSTGFQINPEDGTDDPTKINSVMWTDVNEIGRHWDSNTESQIVEVQSLTSYDDYYDGRWLINGAEQSKVWINTIDNITPALEKYVGVYSGLKAVGPKYISKLDENSSDLTSGNWVKQIDDVSAWDSGTAYVQGNVVTDSGDTYLCLLDNTNQEPPSVFWLLLPDGLNNEIIFDPNLEYSIGDYVQDRRIAYTVKIGSGLTTCKCVPDCGSGFEYWRFAGGNLVSVSDEPCDGSGSGSGSGSGVASWYCLDSAETVIRTWHCLTPNTVDGPESGCPPGSILPLQWTFTLTGVDASTWDQDPNGDYILSYAGVISGTQFWRQLMPPASTNLDTFPGLAGTYCLIRHSPGTPTATLEFWADTGGWVAEYTIADFPCDNMTIMDAEFYHDGLSTPGWPGTINISPVGFLPGSGSGSGSDTTPESSCFYVSVAELAALIEAGYTDLGGPYATEDGCFAACGGGS